MASYPIATLDDGVMAYPYALPNGFSYKPYQQKKRNSITRTAGAVITQYASNLDTLGNATQLIHGDGFLHWRISACYPSEYQEIYELYSTAVPVIYNFKGYWGEELSVLFTVLEPPTVRARLFELNGEFQVLSIITDYAAVCEPL